MISAERRRALTARARMFAGRLSEITEATDYLLARGISQEVAGMFQIGVVTEGEFAGRLSIPYVTPAGVLTIKYRCFKHADCKEVDCVKYLTEAGTGTHLFNAQVLIHAADTVVVTEGELDAICVQAYVGLPAVAYPGTETWQKQKHYRLCFEGVSEVIVVADGEKAGRESARRVAESIGLNARTVDMPAGHDSNSFIASHGAGTFLERLQ